jgi:Putative phospholipid-binding domain.
MQYFANPPIHIIVNNGTVILEGTVNSEAQSGWAENLVRYRTDAFTVENHLQVKAN